MIEDTYLTNITNQFYLIPNDVLQYFLHTLSNLSIRYMQQCAFVNRTNWERCNKCCCIVCDNTRCAVCQI